MTTTTQTRIDIRYPNGECRTMFFTGTCMTQTTKENFEIYYPNNAWLKHSELLTNVESININTVHVTIP